MAAAAQKIDVVIGAKDMYSSRLKQAQAQFKGFGVGVGKAIKAGAVVAAAAIGTLIGVMYKGVQAANVQEDAETRLRQALGHTSTALLNQASALQQVTKYGDETIIQAQSLIASFVKDENQIKAATRATLDLAAAKGMALKNAGDLVSKTLGSSTNALSRYGIQVEGAVGSTERLESLTKGIAEVFGGQAAAQALTYAGRITQMKNAFGDVMEEIGFVITKNQFFNKAIAASTKLFAQWGQHIKNNRQYLMELAKRGIVGVVEGIGSTVEVMRFFHNGWMGIKLVGNAAIHGIAIALEGLMKGLRFLMIPLDLIFEGLKKLGKIESNPFDNIEQALGTFKASSKDVLAETLADIEKNNAAYDKVGNSIKNAAAALRDMKVAAAEETVISTAAAGPTPTEPGGKPALDEADAKKIISIQQAKFQRLREMAIEADLNDREMSALKLQRELEEMEANRIRLEEAGLLTTDFKSQFMLAEENAHYLHEQRLTNIEAQEKSKRADLENKYQSLKMQTAVTGFQNLLILTKTKSKSAFQAVKLLNAGMAIMDSKAAIVGAYKQGATIGGPPLGVAFGAAAALATQPLVSAISGATMGGGGGGGGGISDGGSMPSAPVRTQETGSLIGTDTSTQVAAQGITIVIKGEVVTAETIDKLVEPIVDGINRGGLERDIKINVEALAV